MTFKNLFSFQIFYVLVFIFSVIFFHNMWLCKLVKRDEKVINFELGDRQTSNIRTLRAV